MILPVCEHRIGRKPKNLLTIGHYSIRECEIANYRCNYFDYKTYIYAIICPLSGNVVYIGKTNDPRNRKMQHFSKRPKSLVGKWINAMISIGYQPIFKVIDFKYGMYDSFLEQYYIWEYINQNQATFNINRKTYFYLNSNYVNFNLRTA